MGGSEISYGVVFLLGVVSFLSPCVLPIMPAYLSLISGLSFDELQESDSVRGARWRLFGSALAFIAGFSLVIIGILGGLVTLFGNLDDEWKAWPRIGFGVITFIFALHMLGVFRIPALYKERRFHFNGKRMGYIGALLVGAAFAFGWTPCVGPLLGTVLAVTAITTKTSLLVVYTLGLAIPFLLSAVFVNLFLNSLRKMTKHLRTIEIISGVLLLVMGVLLVTNQLGLVSQQGGFLPDLSMKFEEWLQ